MAALAAAACSMAQVELIGQHRYPQFRGLSGLPGGGFAVKADGSLDFSGAMAYTTPIAYTPGGGRFVFAAGIISNNRKFRFFAERGGADKAEGNGTAYGLAGLDVPGAGRLSTSFMMLSGVQDSVLNFQFQPLIPGNIQVAAGVQDISGVGGSGGTFDQDRESSQSFYLVGTAPFGEKGHVSLGYGTKRFSKGFASASYTVIPRVKGVLEFEGFHWNYGVAVNTGPLWRRGASLMEETVGRNPELTMFVGLTRGKYATWSLAFSF